MAKVGRPKRIWTDEQKVKIEQMALDNCHMDTIALALDVPLQTLTDHFRGYIRQKRAEGRTTLRRAQREKALIGKDTGMLCFLGKNELGQTDKQDIVLKDQRYTPEQRDAIRAKLAERCVNRALPAIPVDSIVRETEDVQR